MDKQPQQQPQPLQKRQFAYRLFEPGTSAADGIFPPTNQATLGLRTVDGNQKSDETTHQLREW